MDTKIGIISIIEIVPSWRHERDINTAPAPPRGRPRRPLRTRPLIRSVGVGPNKRMRPVVARGRRRSFPDRFRLDKSTLRPVLLMTPNINNIVCVCVF